MQKFKELLLAGAIISTLGLVAFAQSRSGSTVITYPTTSSTIINNVTTITNVDYVTTTNLFVTTTITTNLTVNNTTTFKGPVTIQQGQTFYQGVLTHAGTVALDFDPATVTSRSLVLTGALTLSYSNLQTNRNYTLLIKNPQATNCTLTLPSGSQGYFTTTLSNGWHRLTFESWSNVASNVWVSMSSNGTY